MQTLGLALCVTNTQPPGTSGLEVRRSCERAYFPMLDLLEEHSQIRLSMHWSGQLLEWMELHAPERVEQLVDAIVRLAVRGVALAEFRTLDFLPVPTALLPVARAAWP